MCHKALVRREALVRHKALVGHEALVRRDWASKSCLGRYALVWATPRPSRTCLPPAGS